MDHADGAPIAPVDRKTWIQDRTMDALMEYTDRNAQHLAEHIAFDLQLNPIQNTQLIDWLMFSRQWGFSSKLEEDAKP